MMKRIGIAAAAALVLGLLAGCGGLTKSHTVLQVGPVSEIRISPQTATLSVGGKQAFTAVALDNKGLEVTTATFAWDTFDHTVATVNQRGEVTALAPGVTSVTASYSGMIVQARVTVQAGPVQLSFDRDIRPLATTSCSCHASGTTGAKTGSMADLANITAKGYVTAGNPTGSPYFTVGSGGSGHPAGNAWGANQQKVRDWIQEGARP